MPAEKDQEVGVIFPLAGLETTCEFSRQPQDTTAAATNVRTYETITGRARGGSREGMTQYIPAQAIGVSSVIQHLNVLVDPQQPALDANFPALPGYVPDPSTNNLSPRNPGRYVPVGGSGIQLNSNVSNQQKSTNPPALVQQAFGGTDTSGNTVFSFPSNPKAGNLLVVAVVSTNIVTTNGTFPGSGTTVGSPPEVGGVRGGSGGGYTKAITNDPENSVTNSAVGSSGSLQWFSTLWYKAAAGSTDAKITVTGLNPSGGVCHAFEISGTKTGSPVQACGTSSVGNSTGDELTMNLSHTPNEFVITHLYGWRGPLFDPMTNFSYTAVMLGASPGATTVSFDAATGLYNNSIVSLVFTLIGSPAPAPPEGVTTTIVGASWKAANSP